MLLVIVFFSGCTKPPVPTEKQEISPGKAWETAWVEPRIMISDSLFTLIRAERIDSVLIDTRKKPSRTEMPSIVFYITEPSCFVTINLLGPNQSIQKPLVARRFGEGYYKLTLNIDPGYTGPLIDDNWYLQATYCQQTKLVPVRLR